MADDSLYDSTRKKIGRFLLGDSMAGEAADKINLSAKYDQEKSEKEMNGEEMETKDSWMSKHNFHTHPGD